MTENNALVDEVKTVLIQALNLHHVKPETITAATTLGADGLNLDSIDILESVVAVERHFAVKIENSDKGREYFSSVGNIAHFISTQRAGHA
jgi:acyl carrier protein